MTNTTDLTRDSNGVLRGHTGAPINDGSPAFKEEVLSRIEKADRRIGIISVEELFRDLDEHITKRYRKEMA